MTISSDSIACPACHGPLRRKQKDMARPVFVWAFIAFNALMIAWLIFYLVTGKTGLLSPRILSASLRGGDAAGTPVGGNFGLGYLITLWIWGTVVLGLFALPTFANMKKRQSGSQQTNR